MALNNVFIGGGDPLLGPPSNNMSAEIEAYERRLQEALNQVQAQKQMALNPQAQKRASPRYGMRWTRLSRICRT